VVERRKSRDAARLRRTVSAFTTFIAVDKIAGELQLQER